MRIVQNILIIVNVVLIIYLVYSMCNIRREGFHIVDGNVHNHYERNIGYNIASVDNVS